MQTDAFPEQNFSQQCYKHELALLLRLAGLEGEMSQSGPVALRWKSVSEWSEKSRYQLDRDEQEARELVTAINDPIEGVLPWIRSR